jgi:hypothetical protein
MDRIEIAVCRSNGEAVFSAIPQKWLLGSKKDKMSVS